MDELGGYHSELKTAGSQVNEAGYSSGCVYGRRRFQSRYTGEMS